ncbi:MAG: peptidoglycan DD-metalloendopeptidase family protein [Candidatus Pacebacteria bacterium]|jgi:hypothetical protein|nr:peptidoglycan DD-metalloendopeptidase family protein [Candidatus Paceibacterota bacterium]MBP9668093.1 peptidoglycan DD-metalloendopeptidase family protein [Candidatus Saccharibacteria bacterium]
MIKKQYFWVGTFVLATMLYTMPVAAAIAQNDGDSAVGSNTTEWRAGNSQVREGIEDLDSQPVTELPIPVLFGVALKNLTENFGDPRAGHSHEGLDIMAPEGTPIVSPTDAVVVRTGVWQGAGNFVTTAAPGDETFTYMHLSEIADIKVGDVLKPGDIVGYVGHTGNAIASAPHLHLEIRDIDGEATDPYPRLTEVFDMDDKIDYLEAILDDHDDEDELAELLAMRFRAELVAARAAGIELPDSIEKALGQVVDTPVVVASTSSQTLRVGSRGTAVASLQTYLIKRKVGAASRVNADGAFGPITRQALIDYQRSVGLTPDGVYGPKSHAYVIAHS